MYPSVVPALSEILQRHGLDARYYLVLDTTSNKAFAPYQPPAAPSLPFFDDEPKKQKFINNDDIRILMPDDRVISIQDASPVVQMLTQVKYSTVRVCFPEEVRDEVVPFLKQKKLVMSC